MKMRFLSRMNELLLLTGLLAVVSLFSGATVNTVYVKETSFRFSALLVLATGIPLLTGEDFRLLTRFGIPVFLYGVWLLLSVIVARHRPAAAAFLGQQVLFMTVGILVAVRAREPGFAVRILRLVAVLVSITCVYASFQWLGLDVFEWGEFAWELGFRRLSSSFGNPSFFAGFLVGSVPIVFALALTAAAPFTRRALGLIGLLGSVCAMLTFSRAGVVALIAALALFGALLAARPRVPLSALKRSGHVRRVAIGVVLAVLAAAVLAASAPGRAFLARIRSVDVSASTRALVYIGTARMIKAHPLAGVGADNFGAEFPYFRPVSLARSQPPSVLVFDRAHSEYLQVAGELGLPGLFIFLWAVLLPIEAARRFLRRRGGAPDPDRRILLSGILAAYVGILVQNLVSVDLRRTSTLLLFWILWGLCLGLASAGPRMSRGPTSTARLGWRRTAALAGCLLIASPVLVANMRWYLADRLTQQGRIAREKRDRGTTLRAFDRARSLCPSRADIQYFAGAGYYTLGMSDPAQEQDLIRRALDCYLTVERLAGPFADVHLNQATCLLQLGRIDEAIETYRKAILLDPYHAKLHDYVCRAWLLKSRELAGERKTVASEAAREAARQAWELARTYYGPSVEVDSRNADLRLAYARFLTNISPEFIAEPEALKQDLAVAFREVEEAVRLNPDHPGAQDLYRRLLPFAKGAPAEASAPEEAPGYEP